MKYFYLFIALLFTQASLGQNPISSKNWQETIHYLKSLETKLETIQEAEGMEDIQVAKRMVLIENQGAFGTWKALGPRGEELRYQVDVATVENAYEIHYAIIADLGDLVSAKAITSPFLSIELEFKPNSVAYWEREKYGDEWIENENENFSIFDIEFCTKLTGYGSICEEYPFTENSTIFQNTLQSFQRIAELNKQFDKQVQADIDQALESFMNLNLDNTDVVNSGEESLEPKVEEYDFYKKGIVHAEYSFDEANPLFYIGETDNLKADISDGRYLLTNKTGTRYWTKFLSQEKGSSGAPITPDILEGNFDVEISFKVSDRIPDENSAFGLVIGAEWKDKKSISQYNRLTVHSNSNYAIQNFNNGKWTNIEKWTPYPSLDIDKEIKLTLRKYNNILYYFINEELVYQDFFMAFAGDNFGINFSPGSTVAIDYFGFYIFE